MADAIGAEVIELDKTPGVLEEFDILICSTLSAKPLFSYDLLEATLFRRGHQPLFLIDLAVPRNIDPAVARLPNVSLYNLDDLASIASRNQQSRHIEAVRCRSLLRERAEAFCLSWEGSRPAYLSA